MNHEKFKSTIGFTDLLFNILVGFAFLFIVAFLLIKPESKEKDFDRRAEFIVVMEWDSEATDDIDLHVQDPLGGLVNYRAPRVNYSHLDKDDLGSRNDTTVLADGTTTTIKINREVVTIRGIIPGEWIVNSHYYSPYNNFLNKDYSITVRVELHRVTPYKILWVGDKTFTRRGQEETFIRFTIDKEGELVGPFNFREKLFTGPAGRIRTNSAPSGISNSNNNASGLP